MSALAITLFAAALAMLTLALALLAVVLVRQGNALIAAREETALAWASRDDWTEHARLLQNRLDVVDRHYAMTPAYRPWVATSCDGPRHAAAGDITVTMPKVGEGT